MGFRTTFAHVLVLSMAAATLSGATGSRQQAESLVRKLALITRPNAPAQPTGSRRTPVTEGELNSWFMFRGQQYLPAGVSEPTVTIIGNGAVKGAATVDLDAVAKKRPRRGLLDPWNLLGGRVPVSVTGTLKTRDGRGQFDMQSAEVAGIPVPTTLLLELVSMVAATPDQPAGLSIDEPFALPANIRSIDVGRGQLVVVQ